MPWALAESDSQAGQYVSDVQNGQPVFTSNLEEAAWAPKKEPVERYITNNNLTGVTAKTQGGNHPGSKPPIA